MAGRSCWTKVRRSLTSSSGRVSPAAFETLEGQSRASIHAVGLAAPSESRLHLLPFRSPFAACSLALSLSTASLHAMGPPRGRGSKSNSRGRGRGAAAPRGGGGRDRGTFRDHTGMEVPASAIDQDVSSGSGEESGEEGELVCRTVGSPQANPRRFAAPGENADELTAKVPVAMWVSRLAQSSV